MADVKITVLKNGPLLVNGAIDLVDAEGNAIPTEAGRNIALCRCGASTEKPFCDGTHSKIGFQSAAQAVPESKEE